MNERIKELLKQASKLANTDDNKDIDRNFDMIVAEKFAELIVRECANIDFRREVGLTADDDYEIGKVIKEHFGVES
jgi:hypothetical protein